MYYTRMVLQADGILSCYSDADQTTPHDSCAYVAGKEGFCSASDKREGDLKTPTGAFTLHPGYYRPDCITPPKDMPLAMQALDKRSGWCDASDDENYNRFVTLPYAASHEILWRDDKAYDVIIPLAYNTGPITPGAGSAIFFHLMQPDRRVTEGCIAVTHDDMLRILPYLREETEMVIPESFVSKIQGAGPSISR